MLPSGIQVIAGAGWREGPAGEIEALFDWRGWASLHVSAEMFDTQLEITEDIGGYRFPFHFPFRTERHWGRLELTPMKNFRGRVWAENATSVGDGHVESGFENKLWLRKQSFGSSLSYRLEREHRHHVIPRLLPSDHWFPGVRVALRLDNGNMDVGMHFNDVRYLRLKDLNAGHTTVRMDVVPARGLTVFGGWERLELQHDGNSFFDVWPFTVWDVFQARRYRLGDLDLGLDTWFLGLGGGFYRERLDLEISGQFEWWQSGGVMEWLERKPILFPFFFGYDQNEENIDIPFRYAVQLSPAIVIRPASSFAVRIAGQATVPFGKEENAPGATPPPAAGGEPATSSPGGDKSTHGGLSGVVELIFSL